MRTLLSAVAAAGFLYSGCANAQGQFAELVSAGYKVFDPSPAGEIIVKVVDPVAAAKVSVADLIGWQYCHNPRPLRITYVLIDQNNILQFLPTQALGVSTRTCADLDLAVDKM